LRRLSLVCCLLFAFAGEAFAQQFPSGAVSIVVPLAPGDAADISARSMAEEMARRLGVPVLAVNRPGAGGAVGAASVVQAKKDGQTILFAQNSALTFRPAVDPQAVPYHPQKDLVPLGISSRTPSVLAVRADAPYRTLADLVEHAKKNPDKVYIGHPGAGSVGEFCIRLINTLTGVNLVPVPHTGAAPAVTALRGGHVDGVVLALGALGAQIKAGTLRGLATSNTVAEYADIPTLKELGYKEDLFGVWFSFLAPAGIPEDARKALVAAVEEAVKAPAVTAKLAPLGILQSYGSPGQQAAEIHEEFRRISEMLAKARAGIAK
jgi:tripartite-type tricarboxylate transporter receptor subunit TctC